MPRESAVCERCGKEFQYYSNKVRKKARLCSRKCFADFGKQKNWPTNKWIARRFWTNVNIGKPNDCWNWKGTKRRGIFSIGRTFATSTSRFAMILHLGRWLEDTEWVLHDCDNPRCCNPNHLWIGTAQDNTNDMMSKGRHKVPFGEEHWNSKLHEKSIYQIRRLWKTGRWSKSELSRLFDVCHALIGKIISKEIWRHVP